MSKQGDFVSPIEMRLRKELLETRKQLDEVKALLDKAEKRNVKIISKYTQEEVARTVASKTLSLPYAD